MFIKGLCINAQLVGLRLCMYIYTTLYSAMAVYTILVCVCWEAAVVTQLIDDVSRYMLQPSQ